MLTFSYTVTPSLKGEIEKIEQLRREILVELIPRNVELQMRWEANLDRTTQATRLTDKKLKRTEVVEELASERDVETSGYFKAVQWINQAWFLNSDKVGLSDFKKLYSYFPRMNVNEKEAEGILEFIQVNPEHPIVQAGLATVLAVGILPQNANNLELSMLLGNLFLYKYGFDFRGLLNMEEFVAGDLEHFTDLLRRAYQTRNLSAVLEYFAQGVAITAEHTARQAKSREFKGDMRPSYYLLTERQKEILTLFDKPGTKISNRLIQKKFKISQITSSRDLAKLHTLGLIFSAGKGRSVYYTKI